jgi:arylsulfatase A-like enzyme
LPITHGIRDNLPEPKRLVPRHALLSQVLGKQGYVSAFVTDDSRFSYMVPEIGFPRLVQPEVGLQNFAVSVNEPRYRVFHALLHNPIGFGLVPVAAYNQAFGKSYRPQLFTQRALQELSELSREERFFMAVHSCVLHAPGDRNWPWYSMFGQAGYSRGNRFRYSQSGTDVLEGSVQEGLERDASLAEQDVRIYDSGIDMADEMVGGLMSELERSGLLDNTIVVLLSDHGEEMWEPDLPYRWFGPNHGFHGYGDGHNRVLLSIRFPDGAYRGQRVDAPVRLIDLAPTLAELMGLEWPNAFDGRSMVPLMQGGQEPEPRPVYIETGLSEPRYWVPDHVRYPFKKISERYTVSKETGQVHIRPEFQPHLVAAKDRVMQVGDWKLIWFATTGDGQVGLYHRPTDLMNRRDLSAQYPNKTAELGLMMEPYLLADGVLKPIFAQWQAQLARPDRSPDPPPPVAP